MSKNENHKSATPNLFAVAVVSLAVCAVAVMLMPAQASSVAPSSEKIVDVAGTIAMVQAAAGEAGYFQVDTGYQAVHLQPAAFDAADTIAMVRAAAGDAGYFSQR